MAAAAVPLGKGCLLIDKEDLLDWGACLDSGDWDYWDSGANRCADGGDNDSSAGDGEDGGSTDTVDSCDWTGLGLCIEFFNYAGSQGWCEDIGAQYSIDTAYANTPCGGGAVGTCDISDVAGDDYPADATVYYYSEFSNDPADSCANAGGIYN